MAGKIQRAPRLRGVHTAGRGVATFNNGRIGRGVAQAVEGLLSAFTTTMPVAYLNGLQLVASLFLDDLYVGQAAGDAVA